MLSEYVLSPTPLSVNSAFGDIYLGSRKSDGLDVAVKFNAKPSVENNARFARENDILHRLMPHDGIIRPLSQVETDIHDGIEKDYFVMDQADTDLEKWVYSLPPSDIRKRIDIFKQICEALKHSHELGFSHRDLHLGNVLMKQLPAEQIKLIDFGKAYDFIKGAALSDLPAWGGLVMPPEVRMGTVENANSDQYNKGDIYALGFIWKRLFSLDESPTYEMRQIESDNYLFMLQNCAFTSISDYYSLPVSERLHIYREWVDRRAHIFNDFLQIPGINPIYGNKLSDILNKLLNYDDQIRLNTVEQVLIELEGL